LPPFEAVIFVFRARIAHQGIICVLLAVGVACASKPIEVTTPAIVAVDTTNRAPIRLRKAAPAGSFWEAIGNLDADYPTGHHTTPDQSAFAAALRLLMLAQHDKAELLLDSLRRSSGDSIVRMASHILLTATLQYQDKWKELAALPLRESRVDTLDRDKAGVELWAAAFKDAPPRQFVFPPGPVVLPLSLSVAGTPVIPVMVNGRPKRFWLDTGSSMSIIASDVAAECGVEALVKDTLEVATTTGRISARPTSIRQLDIGGITIANSTGMIVASRLLEVYVDDTPTRKRRLAIDGIIGFDIISRLNMRLDYGDGTVTLTKSVRSEGQGEKQRNFFWVGTPIVRLIAPGGIPLHLGLDTGSQETYATDRLLAKTRPRTFIGERTRIGGFGGTTEFRGKFIAELRLSLRGKALLFQKVLVFAPAVSTFVNLDGVLGNDIARTGIIRLDATNGIFSVENRER